MEKKGSTSKNTNLVEDDKSLRSSIYYFFVLSLDLVDKSRFLHGIHFVVKGIDKKLE